MSKRSKLETGVPWIELTTTAADWKQAAPELLATMLGQIQLIRSFEETVLDLAGQGLVHGPAHSSFGQEGGAVGVRATASTARNGVTISSSRRRSRTSRAASSTSTRS